MFTRPFAGTKLALAAALTVAFLAGCKPQPAAPSADAAIAGAASVHSVYITGTLCSGGFECQWAPQATQLDVARHRLFALADKAEINKADAQEIQGLLASVHTYLQDSLTECASDSAGNCTKDIAAASLSMENAVRTLHAARQALDRAAP